MDSSLYYMLLFYILCLNFRTPFFSMNYEGQLKGHRGWITSLACPQQGNSPLLVVSTSRDGTAIAWRANPNYHSNEDVYALADHRLEGHTGFVSSVSLSDDTHAVTGSWDRSLRLWDLRTGQSATKFVKHTKDVLAVAFSPDSRQIVSGGRDNVIRVWNVQGTCVSELPGHEDWVSSICFFPTVGTSKILSGSWDGTAKIWDLESRTCLHTLSKQHTNYVSTVTVSPDGSLCATGGKDGLACLWDVNSGEPLFQINAEASINQIAFSPNRFWMCVATDKNVDVYDLQTKSKIVELVSEVSVKGPECTCVAWSADGNTLYTGYTDNMIRAWSVVV